MNVSLPEAGGKAGVALKDGDMTGEGALLCISLSAPVSPESLKNMDNTALLTLARSLDKELGFEEPLAEVRLEEMSGSPALFSVNRPQGEQDGITSVRLFVVRGDHAFAFWASVSGGKAQADALEAIGRSFRLAPGADAGWKTARDGSLGIAAPEGWGLTVNGAHSGTVWAVMEKTTGEEGQTTLANVALLVHADTVAVGTKPLARLNDGSDEPLIFLALGSRGVLTDAKVSVGKTRLAGQEAQLTTITGSFQGRPATVELRDVTMDGKVLTLVSGWFTPLDAQSAKELEQIYGRVQAGASAQR